MTVNDSNVMTSILKFISVPGMSRWNRILNCDVEFF